METRLVPTRHSSLRWYLVVFLVFVGMVLGGYTYYLNRSGAADLPGMAQGESEGAAAIHLFKGTGNDSGIATTDYLIPTSVLDNDFTIKVTMKAGDLDAAYGRFPIVTLENVDGLRRFRFGRQNSPYGEVFMSRGSSDQGIENSPSGMGAVTFSGDTTFAKGSFSRQVYSDYWFVFKRPTDTLPGYFRVYRNGDLLRATASTFIPFKIDIPAGTETTWTGNSAKPFRIRLGSLVNPVEDVKIAELALWTSVLDSDFVDSGCDTYEAANPLCDSRHWGVATETRQANPSKWTLRYSQALRNLSKKPIALTDAAQRSDQSLYCDFYITDAGVTTSSPHALSAGSAPSGLAITRGTNTSLSSDVPHDWPEWGKPSVSEFQNLSLDVAVSGDTSIHVASMNPGSVNGAFASLPIQRNLYVSKSRYLYKTAAVYSRTKGQTVENLDVTGLDPGTEYFVVGEWIDALENVGTYVVPVRTSGTKPVLSSDKQSLHVTGTVATPSSNYDLPINEPFTMRVYLKRDSADGIQTGKVIELQDALNGTSGYTRFQIGLSASSFTATMTDGSKSAGGYAAFNTFPTNQWVEVWLQYNPPTPYAPGVFRLLKGTQVLVNDVLEPVTDWFNDWDFKKWKMHLRIGDESVARNMYIGPMAWWTRFLDDGEIASLTGKDLGQLSESARYENDLYWYAQPSFNETALTPDLGSAKGAQNVSIPLAGNNMAFSTDYPSLNGPAADQTAPSAGVLSLSGTPEPSSVTLNVPVPDQEAIRRVVHVFREDRMSRRYDRVSPDITLTDSTTSAVLSGLKPDLTYYAYATYYDAAGNYTDSGVLAFTTAGAVSHSLSVQVLLKGRVVSGGTVQSADHSHSAVGIELRNENGTAFSPPLTCYATNSSGGVVSLSTTGGGCSSVLTFIAEHEGTAFSLRVRPLGYLFQTRPVSSANLDGETLTFPQPFNAGSFANAATGEKVELADFSILAAYYNSGVGTPGITQAFQGRSSSTLLNEFAVLSQAYNSSR